MSAKDWVRRWPLTTVYAVLVLYAAYLVWAVGR